MSGLQHPVDGKGGAGRHRAEDRPIDRWDGRKQNRNDIMAPDSAGAEERSAPTDVSAQFRERHFHRPSIDVSIGHVKDCCLVGTAGGESERDALRDVDDLQSALQRDAFDRFDVGKAPQRLIEKNRICRLRYDDPGVFPFRIIWLDGIRHARQPCDGRLPCRRAALIMSAG